MAISKEDIKPLAWSAEDEPTFLKDDENKDGKKRQCCRFCGYDFTHTSHFQNEEEFRRQKKTIMESAEYTLGKGAG